MPASSELFSGIAWVYRRQGRWEDAAANLEKAAELNPLDENTFHNLGETFTNLRRYPQSVQAYERSIAVAPDQEESYTSLSWVYWLWTGDGVRARAELERIPEHDAAPRDWFWTECLEGNYAAALGRVSEASDPFVSVGHYIPMSLLAGFAHEWMGNPERARQAYQAARRELEVQQQERPDDFRLFAALGRTLAGLDLKDEAVRAGERSVEMYPVSKDALAGTVVLVDLADTYTRAGEHEKALDTLEELLSMPSLVSTATLRLDPRWAPLRSNPRYQQLID